MPCATAASRALPQGIAGDGTLFVGGIRPGASRQARLPGPIGACGTRIDGKPAAGGFRAEIFPERTEDPRHIGTLSGARSTAGRQILRAGPDRRTEVAEAAAATVTPSPPAQARNLGGVDDPSIRLANIADLVTDVPLDIARSDAGSPGRVAEARYPGSGRGRAGGRHRRRPGTRPAQGLVAVLECR